MELTAEKGTKYLIDDEDYERLKNYRVYEHFTTNGKTYFVVKAGVGRQPLHRFIKRANFDEVVDHMNGDSTDHRKQNLRLCTHGENNRNRSIVISSQGFKGVRRDVSSKGKRGTYKVRFVAYLCYNYQKIKKYSSGKIGAALKYDCLARDYFGEFSCVNFPQSGEQGVKGWEDNFSYLAKNLQSRTCTYTFMQSQRPAKKIKTGRATFSNKYGYKGVKTKSYKTRSGKRKRKYQAELECEGKRYNRSAKTAKEAAKKYDKLARQVFKDEACLNFPGPNEFGAESHDNNIWRIAEAKGKVGKQANLL